MHFISDTLKVSLVCSKVAFSGTIRCVLEKELSYLAVNELVFKPLTGVLAVGDDEDNVTTAGPCELESNLSTRKPVMLEPNK